MQYKTISVVGLGYVGLPLAVLLARSGLKVYGYDINRDLLERLRQGKFSIHEEDLYRDFEVVRHTGSFIPTDTLKSSDMYFIAVPTPVNEPCHTADLSYVLSAAEAVARVLKPRQVVVIESTIPAGTTHKVKELLAERAGLGRDEFDVAHCPERILPGSIKYELTNNDRIIGADSPETARIVGDIYSRVVTGGKLHYTSILVAEMCKLVENSYRDVNIAFANELSMLCHGLNIDVYELIRLANRHPRVNILYPGVGVGGHCIPVDPWFIVEQFPREARLIKTAREVNMDKTHWIIDQVESAVKQNKELTIGVLGLAYKENIDDLRESPALEIAHVLAARGYRVVTCEPHVKKESVGPFLNLDLSAAVSQSDYLVVTVAHDQFIRNRSLIDTKPAYYCFNIEGCTISKGIIKTA